VPAARIDALEVRISDLKGRKLHLRGEAAKRAKRQDELATLSIGGGGGAVEAKGRQLCIGPLGDDLQTGCPQPGDGLNRDAPLAEPLVGRSDQAETSDGEEQEGDELTVVARRLAPDSKGEHLRGHLGQALRLVCRGNHNAMSTTGIALLDRRAGSMRVVHSHDSKAPTVARRAVEISRQHVE